MARGMDIASGLRRAYMALHRQTQWLLSGHGITSEQFVLLACLSKQDGITQTELTIRAASDPNTVRAILALMENKGLVVRNPDETDRRARRILLTAKGRRLYAKLTKVVEPLQDALLSPFNEQEAEKIVEFLQRVQVAMRQWALAQPHLTRLNANRRTEGNQETLPVTDKKERSHGHKQKMRH